MLCDQCRHYSVCINRIIDDAYSCDEGELDTRFFKKLIDIDYQNWFDSITLETNTEAIRISFFKDNHFVKDKTINIK